MDRHPVNNAQAKLEIMKTWSARKLESRLPAWAKPKRLPEPFKPDLRQVLPNFCTRIPKDTRTVALFRHMPHDMAAYVAEWDKRNRYVRIVPWWQGAIPFA